MKEKISVKRILLDLLFIKEQVLKYFGNNERYLELLRFITEKDYINDDSIRIPTFKEMEQQTGIKTYHIRKQLTEIYEELFDMDKDFNFDFEKCKTYFIIQYNKKYTAFKCKNLKYLPRIGENLELPFVKAKVGCDYFYGQDIRHNFYEKTHTIDIYLKGGMFNAYWYNRLHEAKEKRELPFKDFYDLTEYELKDKLAI